MKKLVYRILAFFNTIESKIAFYPTLMGFAGLSLVVFLSHFEKQGISQRLLENFPRFIIEDGNTALSIITVCIGGLISMMVFSFSMVMLLLSQASSNYSPRLLPGLISDRKNQIILGSYLASVVYLIFVLFSVEPEDKNYALPGLSIIIGILFTFFCLGAFIYFIHNMSQSIQISNILEVIFKKSEFRLKALIKIENNEDEKLLTEFPDSKSWYEYKAGRSGYFQNVSLDNICELCKEYNTRIHITIPKGLFVLSENTFIRSEKELDEETIEQFKSNIKFARGELIEDNYILAFKQITEIAVKAMSPGINDPGTAINALDYLTELFALRLKKLDTGVIISKGKALLKIEVVSFESLLHHVMLSLREYCSHDPIIFKKLNWMLLYLSEQNAKDSDFIKVIENEIMLLNKNNKTEA